MLLAQYEGILIKVVLYISNKRKMYVFCMLFAQHQPEHEKLLDESKSKIRTQADYFGD